MKLLRITIMGLILIIFAVSGEQTTESTSEWKEMLRKYPVPENSVELSLKDFFPKKEDEDKGIYLYKAAHFAYDKEKHVIYVSNWGLHKIYKLTENLKFIKEISRKGEAPSELNYPMHILVDNKHRVIIDGENRRMQIFSEEGEFIDYFRLYKPYYSFAVGKNGLIYATPHLLFPINDKPAESIIEVLDLTGKVINKFGEQIQFPVYTPINNNVLLSIIGDKELIAIWAYFDIVRKYDLNGNLIMEKRIDDKLIKDVAEHNRSDIKYKDGVITARSAIRGVYSDGDNIYILMTYPRLAILELDSSLNIKKYYWSGPFPKYYAKDFFVTRSADNKKMFYILTLGLEANRIEVYSYQ